MSVYLDQRYRVYPGSVDPEGNEVKLARLDVTDRVIDAWAMSYEQANKIGNDLLAYSSPHASKPATGPTDAEIQAAGDACHKQFISSAPPRGPYVGGFIVGAYWMRSEMESETSKWRDLTADAQNGWSGALQQRDRLRAVLKEMLDAAYDVTDPRWRKSWQEEIDAAETALANNPTDPPAPRPGG
jgi:hypothetical protein